MRGGFIDVIELRDKNFWCYNSSNEIVTAKEIIEEYEKTGTKFKIPSENKLLELMDNQSEYDNELEWKYFENWGYWQSFVISSINQYIKQIKIHSNHQIFFGLGETEMPTAEVSFDKRVDSYDIRFKFQKSEWPIINSVITLIKGSIPVGQRAYDPESKTWSVASAAYPICEKIFTTINMPIDKKRPVSAEGFFYEEVLNSKGVETKDTLGEKLKRILSLSDTDMKDSDIVKKAYRRKALILHPDRNNGDGSKMSELNEVWNAYNAL